MSAGLFGPPRCFVCGRSGGRSIQTMPERWQTFETALAVGKSLVKDPEARHAHDRCYSMVRSVLQRRAIAQAEGRTYDAQSL